MRKLLLLASVVCLALFATASAQASQRPHHLRFTVVEQEVPSADQFVDADQSGGEAPTVGDYFTGRSILLKHGVKVGRVNFTGTFTAVNGTNGTVHFIAVAHLRGLGNLTAEADQTLSITEDTPSGWAGPFPISGQFLQWYTGKVRVQTLRVSEQNGNTSLDTFYLHR
jgi:hypothetical protein